jgi:hypothetical protein
VRPVSARDGAFPAGTRGSLPCRGSNGPCEAVERPVASESHGRVEPTTCRYPGLVADFGTDVSGKSILASSARTGDDRTGRGVVAAGPARRPARQATTA